jgi:hypothetical protein
MAKVCIRTYQELCPVVTFETDTDLYSDDDYPEVPDEILARWQKTWDEWKSLQKEMKDFLDDWEWVKKNKT